MKALLEEKLVFIIHFKASYATDAFFGNSVKHPKVFLKMMNRLKDITFLKLDSKQFKVSLRISIDISKKYFGPEKDISVIFLRPRKQRITMKEDNCNSLRITLSYVKEYT